MNFDLDPDIHPGMDFYNMVNKKWVDSTLIPKDTERWGVFNELNESNSKKILDILLQLKDTNDPSYILFRQAMNENKKYNPINFIKIIQAAKTVEELRIVIIKVFTLNGISSANTFSVSNDLNDSNMNILHINSGGLGLPDRDYYFDEKYKNIKEKYIEFISTYLNYINTIIGFELNIIANSIYQIEEYLAKYTFTNVMNRNIELMNNVFSLTEINTFNKYLAEDLKYFFTKTLEKNQIESSLKINITNLVFTEKYYEMLYTQKLDDLKSYFIYLFLRKMGKYIDINCETIIFNFYEKELSGLKEVKPLWKRTVNTLNNVIGMKIGELFVKKYFNEKSKQAIIEMIENIKTELSNKLVLNKWMEPSTIEKALLKLNKIKCKIGYPDEWPSFSELNVDINKPYFENILACYKFNFMKDIKYLYKPINKKEWFMNPQDINAYYSPQTNEIVFPCGILQKPFFSLDQDIASNYGGIGTIIGHEIAHGFDDMGKNFDAYGNLENWWSETDIIQYQIKANKLKNLFNTLSILGKNVNGELTLGENIADLCGVDLAFNALLKIYMRQSSQEKNIVLCNFFYNYATVWRCKMRDEEQIKRLQTDPHAPPSFRVNVILSQLDHFHNTFATFNSKLWVEPNQRINIF
jgi:putative endopeptidase